MMKSLLLITAALLLASLAADACAQDDESRRTELGERQRLIERKMAELETRFEVIAQKLEAKEPERAARLVEALHQAKRDLIAVKMGEITDLLDQSRFQQAEAELDLVIIKLDQLVRLLLNDSEESMTKQQEIDKLQQWKEEITRIKAEEQQQHRETEKVANKDDTLKKLAEQVAAVEELIKKQQVVIEKTTAQVDAGLQALDRLANEQFKVRQETESLAKDIARVEEVDPTAPEQPVASNNESKSGDPKSGDPKSGDPKSGDPRSGESGSSESGTGQPKQPGQQPLEDAVKNQQQAEQDLADGKPVDAKRAEDKALDELNRALAELRKEERRIASLPPEVFREMARKQKVTENQTADLSRDMEKAPKSGESDEEKESGQGNEGQPGQKGQPGQQSVQRAQKAMQNAADDLNDEQPQGASRQQQKSIEELEKALREIEERLDQLREETREEKLARLEARFREMLARQQIATLVTVDIDEKKVFLDRVRRRDVLGTLRVSSEEHEISELGRQAYELLLEDGTSIVFPEMVQVVLEDLGHVARMLESEQTDLITQLIQREIEFSLEELLEALKKSRQESSEGGGGGGGGGNQPLLRKSAELKMLRSAQLRVNRLTQQFDLIRGSDTLEQALVGELEKIRVRQADIVELMSRIMEKQ